MTAHSATSTAAHPFMAPEGDGVQTPALPYADGVAEGLLLPQ